MKTDQNSLPWYVKEYHAKRSLSPELLIAYANNELTTDLQQTLAVELAGVKAQLATVHPFGRQLYEATAVPLERPTTFELANFHGKYSENEETIFSPLSFDIVVFPGLDLRLIHILDSHVRALMTLDQSGTFSLIWYRGTVTDLIKNLGLMHYKVAIDPADLTPAASSVLRGMITIRHNLARVINEAQSSSEIAVFSATEPHHEVKRARIHLIALSSDHRVIVAADTMCTVLIALSASDIEKVMKVTEFAYIDDLQVLAAGECAITEETLPRSLFL